MKRRSPTRSRVSGFTLLELLMVMVLLGVAAVAIASLSAHLFSGQSASRDLVVGTQLLQECAEQVLAVRRNKGYTAVTTSACSGLNLSPDNLGGFGVPSVALAVTGDPGAPSPVTACTSASSFCTVTVSVGKDGTSLAPVVFRLANYEI